MRIILICLAASFPAAAQTAEGSAPFGGAAVVAGAELSAITGQADTAMLIRANNSGTVAGNTINGPSMTGTINFDQQSLSNMSGLSVLSANTDNNVAINSSLNVNVAVRP